MTDSLVIDIPTLRQAISSLLDHVEAANGSKLPLSHDFFWTVPDAERYDNYDRPSELTIGQLSESW